MPASALVSLVAVGVAVASCSRDEPRILPAPEPHTSVVPLAVDTSDPFAPGARHARLDEFATDGWEVDLRSDVNGDGIEDALFHNEGDCGSGGCTLVLVTSDGGGFAPAWQTFAKACWVSADVVDAHASIDCIERFDTCGPYLFLVRATWDGARRAWLERSPTGDDAPAKCPLAALSVDERPREWPIDRVLVLHVHDADLVHDARAYADAVKGGAFPPLLLEGDAIGPGPRLGSAHLGDVVNCAFGDEIAAGTRVRISSRSVDPTGTAWVHTEKGWLKESGLVCVP